MSPDPDESLAQIEADVRRSEQRAAQMPAFEAAVAAVRGVGRSRGRDIRVEVDASGHVVDLRLGESALNRGAERLSRDIVATIRDAESDARAQTVHAVTALLGADDPIVAQLTAPAEAGRAR